MSIRYENLLARFHAQYEPEPNSGCWLWTASIVSGGGYGNFWWKGERRAHRASWRIHHGEIPDGMSVCHRCDVPSCVNPDHLWLGTNIENIADRHAKGRDPATHGERHGMSILTADEVMRIRARRAAGARRDVLATDFGVSVATIKKIIGGHTWRHLL